MEKIKKKILLRYGLAPVVLGLIFFVPAGSLKYWEAWVYICILVNPMLFVVLYFLKKDPQILERRIQFREKEQKQKKLIKIGNILFMVGFLVPGFDHRFQWSYVPLWLIIVSDIIVLVGYMMFFLVLKENSYASRIIEVQQGQRVISTGPYALIRHPMYVAVSIMYLFSPLALGSYWALIPIALIIPIIILRILNEEEILKKDLPGYSEYCEKVRNRLIPFVW